MSRIPIKGFLPNTLIDWEGKVAAEIFLSGCNFRCPFCHSGYLVYDRENECIPLESILACIEREKGWIDGVVISGGEPTLCPALEGLCVEFRNRNLGVKLDTNGSNPALIGRLVNLGLLDFVSLDVKAPLDERYSAATGVMEPPVEQVRESVRLLMRSSIDYEFRTTVV
ncbi:MAG: anaerobic ribonucleoside-triphosphate reductase activating protein, partial [Planctomycetota bacterium]|nr:anaerobic ribonucleoside-triphosphate reductase activating protein [Planctomycetota bacterium]